jgi:four helix bundle protein
VQDFRKLVVWQKAHSVTLDLYRRTRSFPQDERFGLISLIRRAAVSVEANIAEGCGRGGKLDFARFLQQAMGSAAEVECHLLICKDLEIFLVQEYEQLRLKTVEIKRMLTALMERIRYPSLLKTDN